MTITEGHLARHYQGRSGGRDPALLDIAQDHALALLHARGAFELGVALKGGTALRKLRAGNDGRFSTDLDFACDDDTTAALVLESLDGGEIGGFAFRLGNRDGNRRAHLRTSTPFGEPRLPAKVDLSLRGLWLAPEIARMVQLPIHRHYAVALPPIPAMRLEEVIAEKLARYRRTSLARDLYDLAWCAGRPFDELLVRRLWVLKCFFDIVDDGLGRGPVLAADVVGERDGSSFAAEQIGYLTRPVDLPGWIMTVRARYGFLSGLDGEEQQLAQANRGDRWRALGAVQRLSAASS